MPSLSERDRAIGRETLAHGTLEDLITPKLDPGRACLIVIRGHSVGLLHELDASRASIIGRSADVELTIDDVAVSRKHASIESGRDGFALLDLDSTNGIFVNGVRVKHHMLRDGDRVQVGTTTILKFCYQDEVEASFQRQLYDSATRDPLTKIYNRKFFLETLDVDFAHAHKNDTALSLILLDIDHFKNVNDTYGHLAGDQALVDISVLIQKALRTEDVLSRYGGEEFAVLLRFTSGQAAISIAERIREAVRDHTFVFEDHEFRLTVSIGVATIWLRSYESPTDLIKDSDEHLYRAKQSGRNRVAYAFGLNAQPASMTAERADEPDPETPPVEKEQAKTLELPSVGSGSIGSQTMRIGPETLERAGQAAEEAEVANRPAVVPGQGKTVKTQIKRADLAPGSKRKIASSRLKKKKKRPKRR
jgi:diguanylate cyclase (GGDEF)-like protein